jgi:HTH-type transcriptional regulator / antitoxin HigA
MALTSSDLEAIADHLGAIASLIPLHPVTTAGECDVALSALNELLDSGGADEKHPFALLVTLLGGFISDYEDAQSAPK